MAKFIVTALLSLVATQALAAGNPVTHVVVPTVAPCLPPDDNGPMPTTHEGCVGDNQCPTGYKAIPKYCWGKGFYRCGIACTPDIGYGY